MSSNSASGDIRCVGPCLLSDHFRCCCGRGKKMSSTHGCNLGGTRKGCVVFLSTSSCFLPETFRVLLFLVGRRGIGINATGFFIRGKKSEELFDRLGRRGVLGGGFET